MIFFATNCNVLPFQYDKSTDLYRKVLSYMNSTFTAVFTVEALLKIGAFGVRVSLVSRVAGQKVKPGCAASGL